jgi:L-threonylcarbamoyladenylate synthase
MAVHPARRDAAARLFEMKRRPGTRNLPIMVASLADLDGLGVIITDEARLLFDAFSPGPLSVALGLDQEKIPEWLHGRVEVAVRIPRYDAMLDILRATGPLLVTSANIHAEKTPDTLAGVLAALDGDPDLAIDGGTRLEVPSTLVNCNLPVPDIERVGVISRERILEVLG